MERKANQQNGVGQSGYWEREKSRGVNKEKWEKNKRENGEGRDTTE